MYTYATPFIFLQLLDALFIYLPLVLLCASVFVTYIEIVSSSRIVSTAVLSLLISLLKVLFSSITVVFHCKHFSVTFTYSSHLFAEIIHLVYCLPFLLEF